MKNKLKLAKLKRELKKSIQTSRFYHGKWMNFRRAGDHRRGHYNEVQWKKAVKNTQHIQDQIQALQVQMGGGATTPSLAMAKAIGQWEGGQSRDGLFHPYFDSAGGVWTIGYGHTSFDSHVDGNTPPMTQTQAVALLLHDLAAYAQGVAGVLKRYGLKVTQKQFDAFVSFDYNDGLGPFERGRTFGDLLHAKNLRGAAESLKLYVHAANGEVMGGLVRRRDWECQLAEGGTYKVNN